jgi:hypothetical protein
MFHFFERVYLDHAKHVSSKFNCLALAGTAGDHPISQIIGQSVGHVPKFSDHLQEHHNGSIENFWQSLTKKDPKKRFIIYADDEIYFQLLIQYWKSLFEKATDSHLYFLYKSYRQDFLLKSILNHDFGDNPLGLYKDVYKNLSLEAFTSSIREIAPSEYLRSMNKDNVSFEYLLGHYAFDPNCYTREGFRNRILFLGWRNLCGDVNDMKSEIVKMVPQLDIMFPELKYEEFEDPSQFFRTHPQLSWVVDQNIIPESSNHIRRSYPIELFPHMQSLLDKYDGVEIFLKGLPANDLTVINKASKTEFLYSGDFKKILDADIQRGVGSSLFKGDAFFNANHYLINYIYDRIRKGKTSELNDFVLT